MLHVFLGVKEVPFAIFPLGGASLGSQWIPDFVLPFFWTDIKDDILAFLKECHIEVFKKFWGILHCFLPLEDVLTSS